MVLQCQPLTVVWMVQQGYMQVPDLDTKERSGRPKLVTIVAAHHKTQQGMSYRIPPSSKGKDVKHVEVPLRHTPCCTWQSSPVTLCIVYFAICIVHAFHIRFAVANPDSGVLCA